ncbi:MAG: hypothetical protein QOH69_2140 [Actinomycetota bacterium]|nr:hypothetical protein [Actinomycetota bacterium]
MAIEWSIAVGETLLRRELHVLFGGGRYGGIEPSAKSPNVLLFTSATAGAQFGYNFDGWHSDGTFHYTGEGQLGDQLMLNGNRAVRDHIDEGRALRLFEKDGTNVIYVGEFEIPNESYVLIDEAPDIEKQSLRSVFVFRLRPVGESWRGDLPHAPEGEFASSIAIEKSNVESYVLQRQTLEPVTALRAEAGLVSRYVTWIESKYKVTTLRQAIPTAAGHLMYTDIFVNETRELIEAKASSSREHIRTALGQVLDYARYVPHSSLAVLTPTRPAGEMVELLASHGVGSTWELDRKGQFDAIRVADAWTQ